MITELINFGESILPSLLPILDSQICYKTHPDIHTGEYYNYCLNLLAEAVLNHIDPVNVIFGDIDFKFENSNPIIKIDIQPEHTLVKAGGRSVEEVIMGKVKTFEGDNYLVRIPNFKYYSSLDATIEYSIPNIKNIQTAEDTRCLEYAQTSRYIAPVIYEDVNFEDTGKKETITMFSSNPSPRRASFSSRANVVNIKDAFSKEELRVVYYNSKILVNVHQTDHHHTFEELRVLPALCNGVLIISEEVPLKEEIPYSESIIWSSYDRLPETIEKVKENYDYYYKKIFTEKLHNDLVKLQEDNLKNIKDIIKENL